MQYITIISSALSLIISAISLIKIFTSITERFVKIETKFNMFKDTISEQNKEIKIHESNMILFSQRIVKLIIFHRQKK